MLSGRTPDTESAVLLEKQSFFVLFSFVSLKNKGQQRDQQESQNRSRLRDINVLTEEQGGNL